MRRFLVALLIAVAAGTDHMADPVAGDPVANGACEGWCNQYTCESAACHTCDICETVFEGNFCASWCNDYTCGGTTTPPVELCGGCEACEFLRFGDGTRCLPWCNSYTCGQDDCAACNGMIGSPNCLDPFTFCEDWCSSWTCDSPYCVGCSSCEIVDEIAPELKGCTCKNAWADEDCDDPEATQTGCTNCDQDIRGRWCNVDEAPCAGSEAEGGDWFYCDPDFRRLSATGRRMVEEAEALEGPSVLVEERA